MNWGKMSYRSKPAAVSQEGDNRGSVSNALLRYSASFKWSFERKCVGQDCQAAGHATCLKRLEDAVHFSDRENDTEHTLFW